MTNANLSLERPIDLVHLARQTLGDRDLEREILTLFVRQSAQLIARISEAAFANERRDLAHTLRGSALAVGAWRVAKAAEAVENTLSSQAEVACTDTRAISHQIKTLAATIAEANAVILGFTPEN